MNKNSKLKKSVKAELDLLNCKEGLTEIQKMKRDAYKDLLNYIAH